MSENLMSDPLIVHLSEERGDKVLHWIPGESNMADLKPVFND